MFFSFFELDFDARLAVLIDNLERKHFHISLNFFVSISVVEEGELNLRPSRGGCAAKKEVDVLSANQALCVKNRACWIRSGLILSSIADETFTVRERNVRRGNTVPLVISNDLDLAIDIDTNA